jgi:methylated-DNA-[protein]-cysteine S-methyltransferase
MAPIVQTSTMQTPIGPLTVLVSDDIVRAAGFTDDPALLAEMLAPELKAAARVPVADLGSITTALADYFDGDLPALDSLPVEQPGGPFQQRAWTALRGVPPGVLTSYQSLAGSLGGEQLARAVGMACATNKIAPIIPCHRVIGSNGNLTGYLWGLDRKRWLLVHERRNAPLAGSVRLAATGRSVG